MNTKENYDPAEPVCQNQDDFNMAIRRAIRYNMDENAKLSVNAQIALVLYVLLSVYAVVLASRVVEGPQRTLHLTLAMITGPVYVVGHLVGGLVSSMARKE